MIATDGAGRIPTVLCIDVEPDGNPPHPAASWPGFESMLAYTDELRDRVAVVTGAPVRFTWVLRMDPQIEALQGSTRWLGDRYATELDRLCAAGDSIGVHTHAWRRADASDPHAWIADWGDPGWVEQCLDQALSSFAQAFGRPCVVHRFGDRFLTARLQARLGAHGVKVDLTVEPGARSVGALYPGWQTTHRPPDYAAAPRAPYLPDPQDPLRPSRDQDAPGPWQLPLTAVDASDTLPLWRRIAREVRYPGRVRHRPVVLWAPGPADALWSMVDRELATSAEPYLAFAIRSDVLLSARSAVPFSEKVDALLRSPLAQRLAFTDPISALATLRPAATASAIPANAHSGV